MNPAIVMVCGSSRSMLGYSSNLQPSFTIPTAIAVRYEHTLSGSAPSSSDVPHTSTSLPQQLNDLDCCVGDEAVARQGDRTLYWPVKRGLVRDWDLMERFWQQCLFSYLRVDPEAHTVVVPQAPHASAVQRAAAAEVLFETLGVAGAVLPPLPVLVLCAAQACSSGTKAYDPSRLTGLVVHCGDLLTHVTPVVEGCVMDTYRRSTQLAGRHVTQAVHDLLRSRGASLPADAALEVARRIKESQCYVCFNAPQEGEKYDSNERKYAVEHTGRHPGTNQRYAFTLSRERFLGPEVLFNPAGVPGLAEVQGVTPLAQLVVEVVQACPVDTRRLLYANIVLSGGSSKLRHLDRRMQHEVDKLVNARLRPEAKRIEVQVVPQTATPSHAAFAGASLLVQAPGFSSVAVTRSQYLEQGKSSVACLSAGMCGRDF